MCCGLGSFRVPVTSSRHSNCIHSISPKEVAETLRSLPNKSSCGSDEISYRLMKEAGPDLLGPLVTLFNRSLLLRQFLMSGRKL